MLIEVAKQSIDDNIGLGDLRAAHIVIVESMIAGVEKGSRRVFCQITGDFPDFFRRDVSNSCGFFRREVFIGVPELIESEYIFLNKNFIV